MATTAAAHEMAERLAERLHRLVHRLGPALEHSPGAVAQELSDLAQQVRSLPAHVINSNGSNGNEPNAESVQPSKKQKKACKQFDFSKYQQRHVALEIMYLGWSFQGFARQDNTENTIEAQFFKALRKTRLIPEDADISGLKYSRCGRTDKGVSALGQVVALMLRSNGRAEEPLLPMEQELDYPCIINKALPEEIRVLGWAAVPDGFNARFSATWREYKYFIVQSGNLDIGSMQAAARHFIGEHDFRNFCKADVVAVKNFRRTILDFRIEPCGPATGAHGDGSGAPAAAAAAAAAVQDTTRDNGNGANQSNAVDAWHGMTSSHQQAASGLGSNGDGSITAVDGTAQRASACSEVCEASTSGRPQAGQLSSTAGVSQVYAMTVCGTAFLWHQVRCMAAVLLMVGRGQEDPSVVLRLLDIGAMPCKPQYAMAAEEPLLLYACGFKRLSFRRSHRLAAANVALMTSMMERHLIFSAMTCCIRTRLLGDGTEPEPEGYVRKSGGGSSHIPLLKRQCEPSIEEKMKRRGVTQPVPANGCDDMME